MLNCLMLECLFQSIRSWSSRKLSQWWFQPCCWAHLHTCKLWSRELWSSKPKWLPRYYTLKKCKYKHAIYNIYSDAMIFKLCTVFLIEGFETLQVKEFHHLVSNKQLCLRSGLSGNKMHKFRRTLLTRLRWCKLAQLGPIFCALLSIQCLQEPAYN